ncbi:hypothetical protein [Lactococcus sp.]|uniref:hypothetical protein n=1 Tax=Lactococcus sp. TaxID=44273 RepID=UPI0035B0E8A8
MILACFMLAIGLYRLIQKRKLRKKSRFFFISGVLLYFLGFLLIFLQPSSAQKSTVNASGAGQSQAKTTASQSSNKSTTNHSSEATSNQSTQNGSASASKGSSQATNSGATNSGNSISVASTTSSNSTQSAASNTSDHTDFYSAMSAQVSAINSMAGKNVIESISAGSTYPSLVVTLNPAVVSAANASQYAKAQAYGTSYLMSVAKSYGVSPSISYR